MTNSEKIEMLSVLSGEKNIDILSTYLFIAANKICRTAYPFDDTVIEVPGKYEGLQLEIATYLLNKRGAEGETSHSENGISRSYENADIPISMLSIIQPFVGTISGGINDENNEKE